MTIQRRADGSLQHLITLEGLKRAEIEALLERHLVDQLLIHRHGEPSIIEDFLLELPRLPAGVT